MIHEVMLRRFSKPDPPPPDLILIDGGKGQLAAAKKALESLNLEIPIISLAKSRTRSAFTKKDVEKTEERVFVPLRKNPLNLKETNPALKLLQQVRDEAHRFSIESHRRRRSKEMLTESFLTDLPGIGEKTRSELLKHFGDLEQIRLASVEDLVKSGLSKRQAETLNGFFSAKTEEE